MKVAGKCGLPGKVASTMFWPASGPSCRSASAWPVTAEVTVNDAVGLGVPTEPFVFGALRTARPTSDRLPPPWMIVKVTGMPSMPLQESLTQARSGSLRKAPTSAFWLFPMPTLIWLARAGLEEAQKKTLFEIPALVTQRRLLPQPAAPPRVQMAAASPFES